MSLNLDFKVQKEQKVREIEDSLQNYLPKQKGYQKIIMEAMGYSLLAGGKRLRPMLMKETYTLFGGHSKVIEPFMAAIEMVHTYSLVHEDLPAMDNDEYRRGRKPTHVVYGEDMAILAGDAMLNYAFETAFRAFEQSPEDSLKIGRALTVLGRKAGIYGMIGGQVIDVKETGHAVSKDVLDTIYELKTGALIECAMMIGAILGGASDEEIQSVEKIAHYVGVAFQIQDDILDITMNSFIKGDLNLARQVEPMEEVIDGLSLDVKQRHVRRLRKGKCTIELGFILSDVITNFERVSDHCSNIAVCLVQVNEDEFDTHAYLDELRQEDNKDFQSKVLACRE